MSFQRSIRGLLQMVGDGGYVYIDNGGEQRSPSTVLAITARFLIHRPRGQSRGMEWAAERLSEGQLGSPTAIHAAIDRLTTRIRDDRRRAHDIAQPIPQQQS